MENIKAFLLDMDGVVTNTESQYEAFWDRLKDKYGLKMDDFKHRVKGKRLKDIVSEFFSFLPIEKQKNVANDIRTYELEEMVYTPINGVLEFVKSLKKSKYKTALVTGSLRIRAQKAMKDIGLTDYFDILITADDVTKGKPDPECFRMGAEKLGVLPSECIVFEDAFNGIESAKLAGVEKIVGIMTNYSKEELTKVATIAIPDFDGLTIEDVLLKIK
ncbi:HAD family hydrolase [Apibacter adventoris]|uniref:HAD family phosphatase n=1 Tax=Apibacter adventoris TaxID=1679466 RepID=A0A2S8AEZ6_9FLAO|nr:HAD family phosphatase [Apibacter adventoris]PQL94108.1 HAD family phosphatase [Apibacter adventoris]